jgi:hypothetical protein
MVSTLQKQAIQNQYKSPSTRPLLVVERGVESKIPFKSTHLHVVFDQKQNPHMGQDEAHKYGGPGWCILCKDDEEIVPHLFLWCPFVKQIWSECSQALGQACVWLGQSIEEAWRTWVTNPSNNIIKALPLIINWGAWLARNALFSIIICQSHNL